MEKYIPKYLQWLGSAYIQLILADSPHMNLKRLHENIETYIKFNAILGTKILLNDVQIISSAQLLNLFASRDFRNNFLQHNPEFFTLKAWVQDNPNPKQFDITVSGLERTKNKVWRADPTEVTPAVKKIALNILDNKQLDITKEIHDKQSIFNLAVSDLPQYEKQLTGMLYCLDHFAYGHKVPVLQATNKPVSLYTVLSELIEGDKISEEMKINLIKTKDFIDEHIENESDRGMQSKIFTEAEKYYGDTRNLGCRIVKNNTHQAWTEAVLRTIDSESESLGFLSESVDIGVQINRPTDILVPVTNENGKYMVENLSFRKPLLWIDWDPAKLTWKKVNEICEETSESAEELQMSMIKYNPTDNSTVEALGYALEKHIEKVGNILAADKPSPRLPGWLWAVGSFLVIVAPGTILENIGHGLILTQLAEAYWVHMREKTLKYDIQNVLRKAATQSITT
jgi:hypothetical protein